MIVHEDRSEHDLKVKQIRPTQQTKESLREDSRGC